MNKKVRREKRSGQKIFALIFVFLSVFCIVFFAARGKFAAPAASQGLMLILSPFQSVVSWTGDNSRRRNDSVQVYYDTEKADWRCFKRANLIRIA